MLKSQDAVDAVDGEPCSAALARQPQGPHEGHADAGRVTVRSIATGDVAFLWLAAPAALGRWHFAVAFR